ncbi:M48 family metalloprotease [bacterium]|nr:M48 family metalloprotease [bacterium]
MSLSGFFHSWPGLYMAQAFFHSLVASVIAEIAIKAWGVRDPAVRQRVFLVPIVAPVFLFPLFQRFSPERGSMYFRLGTVFESGRWLEIEILGTHPVMGGLVVVFTITSLVFLFQELIPILRHSFESGKPEKAVGKIDCLEDPAIRTAMETLPVAPAVLVVENDDLLIYSTTGNSAAVYVSSSLVSTLTEVELRSAVAHEISHLIRSRHPMLVGAYLLRTLMFFNPVVLMEFRRAAQEEEKVCDEFAVSITRNRSALVQALRKLYLPPEEPPPPGGRRTRKTASEIEERSHRLNIESRISRLESGEDHDPGIRWLVPTAVAAATVLVNYFIV